jgi:hypothetical protein
LGVGDTGVWKYANDLSYYIRFPNLKIVVLAGVVAYGADYFVDMTLLDVPMTYQNFQQFRAQKAQQDEVARKQEFQRQGPSKF